MPKNELNSEQRFLRNFLIGFFASLFIVFFISLVALFQALINYPSTSTLPTVTIQSCYDGDTCTTSTGEKIRLACIDTPELRGKRADPIPAKAARDHLNNLVSGSKVRIRRITEDRHGRTVAELYKGHINIQEQLVDKGFASTYKKYAHQCEWSQ